MPFFTNQSLARIALIVATLMSLTVSSFAAEPNLVAAFFVKGKVGLKWTQVDGIAEYSVYRKIADGDFEKIATVDDDHHFDVDVTPGAVYTYRIGVGGSGGDEVFSGEKMVTIPGQTGEFKPPSWTGLRVEQDKIYLNWDPVPNAIAYNILRSTTPGEGYEVVGNAQSSRYVDRTDLQKGTTYYYRLTAMNAEFEETESSPERSVKYGLSLEEQQALEAGENRVALETAQLTPLFEITNCGGGVMNQPADVFVNSEGNIYVTDVLNGAVRCFDPDGKFLFSFGEKSTIKDPDSKPPGTFLLPFTLFIDARNQVYVSDIDGEDIQVFSADGEFLQRIRVETNGMNGLRANGMHVLEDGRLVVTDTGNHRFLVIDRTGNILMESGSRGSEPGQFIFPDELVVSEDGTVSIVDVINCRIQQFDLQGNFVRQFGSIGQSAGTFARPKGISIDEKGRLWVSDAMSNMLQSFTAEGEVKSAVGTAADEWRFVTPRGMFFKDGRMYVVNRVPNKVVVFAVG